MIGRGFPYPGTTSSSSSLVTSALLSPILCVATSVMTGVEVGTRFIFFARVSGIYSWLLGPRLARWSCLRRGLRTCKCPLPPCQTPLPKQCPPFPLRPPLGPVMSLWPCHLPLWSLVPREEVGGEGSLASGLDYCQRKLPGSLWCLGWLGRREKGREEVLPATPPTTHRNTTTPPPVSSATPPSTPTRLTGLSFSPLQLGAQDSLSMAGDTMGASTPPPQPFSWAYGLPTMRALACQD